MEHESARGNNFRWLEKGHSKRIRYKAEFIQDERKAVSL